MLCASVWLTCHLMLPPPPQPPFSLSLQALTLHHPRKVLSLVCIRSCCAIDAVVYNQDTSVAGSERCCLSLSSLEEEARVLVLLRSRSKVCLVSGPQGASSRPCLKNLLFWSSATWPLPLLVPWSCFNCARTNEGTAHFHACADRHPHPPGPN